MYIHIYHYLLLLLLLSLIIIHYFCFYGVNSDSDGKINQIQ